MKALVVGLGISGLAAARLLLSKGESVWVTEKDGDSHLIPPEGVVSELDGHTEEFVKDKDLIVISPGVQPGSEVLLWADKYKVPVISELELASRYVKCPLVCVTGTNGKSTVTSLIDHILSCAGKETIACGNLGIPLSEVALKCEDLDAAVVEVSSFQLGFIRNFRPYVSVWLNFSCDHLDYHASMEDYLSAKKRIFENQTRADWAVINYNESGRIGEMSARRLFYNGGNTEAARVTAGIFGIRGDVVEKAIRTFKPLPHRMQYTAEVDGINFIDDSKATNVHAVNYALGSLKWPVILILGGRDKGGDFTKLNLEKVSCVVVMGEAKEKIISQIRGKAPFVSVSNLDEAVDYAYNNAGRGTAVLLSPGCSSFDMFRDYSERGERYQEAVFRLKEACLSEK